MVQINHQSGSPKYRQAPGGTNKEKLARAVQKEGSEMVSTALNRRDGQGAFASVGPNQGWGKNAWNHIFPDKDKPKQMFEKPKGTMVKGMKIPVPKSGGATA